MSRNKGAKITYVKYTTILCQWCGEHRETARVDTKTCGPRCRARLKFFVDYLGYAPDGIPGPITGQQAVDLELHRLITDEQRRRRRRRRNESVPRALRASPSAALSRRAGRTASASGRPFCSHHTRENQP